MYHICAAQCQTQFLFGKKFVGHDLRAAEHGRLHVSPARSCAGHLPTLRRHAKPKAPRRCAPKLRPWSRRAPRPRLARQPKRAERRLGKQRSTMPPRSGGTVTSAFSARGKRPFFDRLVDMLAVGGDPAATARQVSLQVRYDGLVRADDKTDEFIRLGWPTRDDAGAIVHLVQGLLRAGSPYASASAGASASAVTSSAVIQPAFRRASSTICSASARDTEWLASTPGKNLVSPSLRSFQPTRSSAA